MNNYNFEDLKDDNERKSTKRTLMLSTVVCIVLCAVAVFAWLFILNKKEERKIQQDISGYEWMYSFSDAEFQAYPIDDSFLSVSNVLNSFDSNFKDINEKKDKIAPIAVQTDRSKGKDTAIFEEYVDAVSLSK